MYTPHYTSGETYRSLSPPIYCVSFWSLSILDNFFWGSHSISFITFLLCFVVLHSSFSLTLHMDDSKIVNTLQNFDNSIQQIHSALPPNSLFIVGTVLGDTRKLDALKQNEIEKGEERREEKEMECEKVRQAISFFGIK